MTSSLVQSFPWHALDATTRAQASAQAYARRAARHLVRLEGVLDAMGTLLGARITVRVRRVAIADADGPAANGVGVLLARADDPELGRGVLLDAEPALAAALVARALKRPPPKVVDPARGGSHAVAGALGAVLVAAARSAHAGAPLRVAFAGDARSGAQALGAELLVATLTVLVDDEAFVARAVFPATRALSLADAAWDMSALTAQGDLPLSLAIVACASRARASDIAALSPGDAWMPGEWRLGHPGALSGPVSVAAAASEHGLAADLGDDGRVVVRGTRVALSWDDEGVTMTDQDKDTDTEAIASALGDVPVVVRVEIGVVQMRARAWAALCEGDVVTTGHKIADPVVLRVGGVEVARGELVEIEGEVGVRILSRSGGGA